LRGRLPRGESMKRQTANGPSQAQAFSGRTTKPALHRVTFAVLCALAAFSVRLILSSELGDELPFMLFVASALVAAWYGGVLSGVVALVIGLFLAGYFLIGRGSASALEWVRVVRYLFTAGLGVLLIERLHRGGRALHISAQGLAAEVARRKRSEEALLEAQAQLRVHASDLEHYVAERTAQLADTLESLEEVLYQMAHHLRAPLRAMEGYSTALSAEYASVLGETGRQYAARVCKAARRMEALIQALLEFGRLGHLQPQLTETDLETVVDLALAHVGGLIRQTQATVQVVRPLPRVLANQGLLGLVLVNLLENAFKFVAPGITPEVQIHSEFRGEKLRLWIDDNGVGVAPAYQERIFGAFEKLYPTEGDDSTGIGLAIVRQGIRRMGGEVGIESQAGSGSRFWIELAAVDHAPAVLDSKRGQPKVWLAK